MDPRDKQTGRTFVKRMRLAMRRRRLTTMDLAKACNRPYTTLDYILRGGVPNVGLEMDIAQALDVRLDELLPQESLTSESANS